MANPWYVELTRLIIVVAFCFVVGTLLEQTLTVIVIGLVLMTLWYIQQGVRARNWLRDPGSNQEPQGTGVWADIFGLLASHKRKHQEEVRELEETLARYRQAIRALPEGAITLGADDDIELFNATASRLLGLKDPEDLGSPVTHLVREPDFIRYMEEGEFTDALEIVHENVPLSVRVVPYGGLGKKLLLVRDMTRLLKLERMRRDFVANVSHELKSPLTVIKGYVESLLDETGKVAGSASKPLNQIELQTERMCHIVEDLLQLSNLETSSDPDKPVPIDIPALIRSISAEAREISGGGHVIETDVDDQLIIEGNFNELYSAFSNILLNAVTYTPEGGRIDVYWKLDQGRPVFSVKDNGAGIAPEHIPRLTERFYRVDQARSRELGGTGLGLAIVKHVLLRHKAELRITSRLNQGSTFRCVFPEDSVRNRDQRVSNA